MLCPLVRLICWHRRGVTRFAAPKMTYDTLAISTFFYGTIVICIGYLRLLLVKRFCVILVVHVVMRI